MVEQTNKQKIISVIGTNFLDFVVWDLVDKSLSTYLNTNFSKKRFQTSIIEHSTAAAAIVLSVIGIEAIRNRIYFLRKSKIDRRSVPNDLCKLLTDENANYPTEKLKNILDYYLADMHNLRYRLPLFEKSR